MTTEEIHKLPLKEQEFIHKFQLEKVAYDTFKSILRNYNYLVKKNLL